MIIFVPFFSTSNLFFSFDLPLPLRPTNLKSLNLATWFFITAVQFRSSEHQFSSLPAFIVTIVPSPTSANVTTLNATGSVLFDLQWFGSEEHKIYGLPVRTETLKKKTNKISGKGEKESKKSCEVGSSSRSSVFHTRDESELTGFWKHRSNLFSVWTLYEHESRIWYRNFSVDWITPLGSVMKQKDFEVMKTAQ